MYSYINDVDKLRQEITTSESHRDNVALRGYEQLIDQVSGRGGSSSGTSGGEGDGAGGAEYPENIAGSYLALMVPKIVISNPRVTVKSRREVAKRLIQELQQNLVIAVDGGMISPDQAQEMMEDVTAVNMTTEAVKHDVNRWISDTNYVNKLDRVCYHFLMAWGIILTATRSRGNGKREIVKKVIEPTRFFGDQAAMHPDEREWCGHWDVVDKESLVKKAEAAGKENGWDIDAVKGMSSGTDPSDSRGDKKPGSHRETIKVYQLWFREYTEEKWAQEGYVPEEGYNGAMVLMGAHSNGKGGFSGSGFLRKPRPAFCPKWGPYAEIGCYTVPERDYYLSPLLAVHQQMNELNLLAQATNVAARNYKRLILVSSESAELAEKLREEPHDFVVLVDNLHKDQVVVSEQGGVTDQMIVQLKMQQDRTERMLGITEAQQGRPQPGIKATADAIADDASETRVDYKKNRFARGVQRDLMANLHYTLFDDTISNSLGPEAGDVLSMLNPIIDGGGNNMGLTVEDFELELEAYSMGRMNEMTLQRRIIEMLGMIMNTLPIMVTMPWVNIKEVLDQIGDAFNFQDLSKMIDVEMLRQLQQMAMQAGAIGTAEQMSGDGAQRNQQDRKSLPEGGGEAKYPAMARAQQIGQTGSLARSA